MKLRPSHFRRAAVWPCLILLLAFHLAGIPDARASEESPSPLQYAVRLGNPPFSQPPIMGGDQLDSVAGIVVDSAGNAYIAGTTYSPVFPEPGPPLQPFVGPNTSWGFLAKLKPDGHGFAFVKILASSVHPVGIAVDPAGNAYLTGTVLGPIDPSPPSLLRARFDAIVDGDVFVAKFDPSGKLLWHSYLGGRGWDHAAGIAVDPVGCVYVTGSTRSPDFPTGMYAPIVRFPATGSYASAGFVTKLNASGTAIIFSTFLGGSEWTASSAIAVDRAGSVYVAGSTSSPDFPVSSAALQPHPRVGPDGLVRDAFVVKLKPDGRGFLYSTYLGGSWGDYAYGIAIDSSRDAYVTGSSSSGDFPLTSGAAQDKRPAPCADIIPAYCEDVGFLTKINPSGTAAVYSTYIGGRGSSGYAVAVDHAGNAYITGVSGDGLTAVRAFQPSFYGGLCYVFSLSGTVPLNSYICSDAFAAGISANGSGFLFSTYLNGYEKDRGNGIAVGPANTVFVAGSGALSVAARDSTWTKGNAFLVRMRTGVTPISFTRESVTNGASFASGLVPPGGLATIFCSNLQGISGVIGATGFPLPRELGGVSVLLDGIPAPLLAVADVDGRQQINFQVPDGIAPYPEFSEADVVVKQHGNWGFVTGARFDLSPPGVFRVDDNYGAIQQASDYTLVTPANPAARGEVVIVYATGLGPVEPAPEIGFPTPHDPLPSTVEQPMVTVGGHPVEVLFAGLTPGFAGLYQLNIRIPIDSPSGDVDLLVSLPPVQDRWDWYLRPVSRISRPVRISVK